MAVLIFRLRGVPDDEVAEVRELLHANTIDFYETTSGSWGVSMPGIWLHDKAKQSAAKALIEAYQAQRAIDARNNYAELKERGEHRRLWQGIMTHPIRFLMVLLLIGFILYISLSPFIHFA